MNRVVLVVLVAMLGLLVVFTISVAWSLFKRRR